MPELKIINAQGVQSALKKAKWYRLLGEPDEAESICMDVLAVEPDHQEALVTLLLAMTDRFAEAGLQPSFDQALDIAARLESAYHKSYYMGLIYERRAKFHFRQGGPEADATAYAWFAKAMHEFGEALSDSSADNQEAVLRWNSCVRFINGHPELKSFDAGQATES